MDAFEDLVARLVRREGYWTRQNYMVNISKADKVAIGLPSMPRPEVDIVAYRPATNTVVWVECKSYLDSHGVQMAAFDGSNSKFAKRFRIFTNQTFREIVTGRLVEQLIEEGCALSGASVEHWLVAGKIAHKSATPVADHFAANGWRLIDREWIRASLQAVSKEGYEDDVVTMAAKLLS